MDASCSTFYNAFAHLYDHWVMHDAQNQSLLSFYINQINQCDASTTVVYLGVATGRLALEMLQATPHLMIGVDNARHMLRHAKQRFEEAGVSTRVHLMAQDFRALHLEEAHYLYIMPFRTLSHLLTPSAQRHFFQSLFLQMREGERFIFDMDVVHVSQLNADEPALGVHYFNASDGESIVSKFTYDVPAQSVDVTLYHGYHNGQTLEQLSRYTYQNSWITPEQVAAMVTAIGFRIKHSDINATHQCWVIQK